MKSRRPGGSTGGAEAALTERKLARVSRAASHLLATRGVPDAPRVFIGAAVDLDASGQPGDVRLIPVEEIR